MYVFEQMDDSKEQDNPPALSAIPLELRVWNATEMGSGLKAFLRAKTKIRPRRLASYAHTCAYGAGKRVRDVFECIPPDATRRPVGKPTKFLEFRVDLGRLGQNVEDPAERPNVGVWIGVDGWPQGADLSLVVARPELADAGAIDEDDGDETEQAETRRGRRAAGALARKFNSLIDPKGTGLWPWTYRPPESMSGEAAAAQAEAKAKAKAANVSALPPLYDSPLESLPFSLAAYELAVEKHDVAFKAAYEATVRPDVAMAAYVPRRYAPGYEPLRRVVHVWSYIYAPQDWYVRLVPRLVENCLLNGCSAVMAYVGKEFGEELLADPLVATMVNNGVLVLVHWRPFAAPIGVAYSAQHLINSHAVLAHWGRNVMVAVTNMGEMLTIPPRNLRNELEVRRAKEIAANDDRYEDVERLGLLPPKKRHASAKPSSSDLWTTALRPPPMRTARRPAPKGAGGIFAGRPGGFYAAETNLYAIQRISDSEYPRSARARAKAAKAKARAKAHEKAIARAAKAARAASARDRYNHNFKSKLLEEVPFEEEPLEFLDVFTPESQLAPMTPRQRRAAEAFQPDGCLHQALRDELSKDKNMTEGMLRALRNPRCGVFHCLPVHMRDSDADDEHAPDGKRIAGAPSMADAMREPMTGPVFFNWRKPLVDPDAVPGVGMHWSAECLGGRSQAWGRPPPGGVGAQLPIRKRDDGYWDLEELGLSQTLSTRGRLPPRIESACRVKRNCPLMPYHCLGMRYLINLSVRKPSKSKTDAVSNDWQWVYHESNPTRAYPS